MIRKIPFLIVVSALVLLLPANSAIADAPGNTKFGAYFFYWHDASADPAIGNWRPADFKYHPTGAYPAYSSLSKAWYAAEIADMSRAGIDYIFAVCWGDHPWPHFATSVLAGLRDAIAESGSSLKVGIDDDTTSECCEWNYLNGRGYTSEPRMPIDNPANWSYFYDRKIKPFFQLFPKSMWATHNGRTVEEGGRPIIIVYSADFFSGLTSAHTMWAAIRQSFQRDFKDAGGRAINPFIILDYSWLLADPALAGVQDGYCAWGAAMFGANSFSTNGYRVSEIGPGYDDRLIRSPGQFRPRNKSLAGTVGSEDAFLTTEFAKVVQDRPYNSYVDTNHLVLVETWNELWEGTTIERCSDYSANAGGFLSPTYYIDSLGTQIKNFKAAQKPAQINLDRAWLNFGGPVGVVPTSTQTVLVSNAGYGPLTWSAASNKSWLTVTPASGSGTAGIQIGVNPAGLKPGVWTGEISVSSPQAANSPQKVTVNLYKPPKK